MSTFSCRVDHFCLTTNLSCAVNLPHAMITTAYSVQMKATIIFLGEENNGRTKFVTSDVFHFELLGFKCIL
jgi:hypothetical protein